MRTYELVLVFDPALEVEQIDQDLRKLNDMMVAGGAPRRWERWGKRRLAYEISSRQYGYYVLAIFDSETSVVSEIDRSIRLNAAVIRHLITIVDPKRIPDADPESLRTLGAAPETVPEAAPSAATPAEDISVAGADIPDVEDDLEGVDLDKSDTPTQEA